MHDLHSSPLISVAMLNVSLLFSGGFDGPPGPGTGTSFPAARGSPMTAENAAANGVLALMLGPANGLLGNGEQVGQIDGWSAEHLSVNSDLIDVDPYEDLTQIPAIWLTFVVAFGLVWILALTGETFFQVFRLSLLL